MAEPDLDQLPGDEVSFLSSTTSRKIRDGENFSEAAIAVNSGHFDKQKRITLLFCILPVTLLLCLSTSFLFVEVRAHLAGQRLRVNVRFAARLSDVIHNLQQERDMTAFFLSSQMSKTKSDLDKLYGKTDISLVGLDTWPADNMPTEQLKSKSNFQRILNEHRASVNASASASASTAVTYSSEITFYSGLISEMMNWLVKSINIPEASIMYEDLVALQQAMEAKDAFGLERAYGVVCLTIGGFRNRSDHWDFTDSQATADITFKSAVEYSDLLRDNYHIYVTKEKRLADVIKQMRNEISKMKVLEDENLLQPSVERALWWFDNMTIYIDAVFVMTVNVRQTIIDRVSISEEYDTIRLSGICVVLLVILALCGVIGWEVNELMKEYEQSCVMLANRVTEKKRLDDFLDELRFGNLPPVIGQQLSRKEPVPTKLEPNVTVLTAHITGLPPVNDRTAAEITSITREVLSMFNALVDRFGMFTPEPNTYPPIVISGMGAIGPHAEAQKMARFALELLDDVNKIRTDALGAAQISVRIAIHTAPTVVGLVNTDEIPNYVFPGNTLPILTKLINCSGDGRIHMSYPTFQIIHDLNGFVTRQRKTKIDNEVEWTPTAWLLGLAGASLSDDQDRDSLVVLVKNMSQLRCHWCGSALLSFNFKFTSQ